jgi:hypothetical protein
MVDDTRGVVLSWVVIIFACTALFAVVTLGLPPM